MDFWDDYENYFYFLQQSNGPIIYEMFTRHFHIGWLFRLGIEHKKQCISSIGNTCALLVVDDILKYDHAFHYANCVSLQYKYPCNCNK